jgi:hypothetical protein
MARTADRIEADLRRACGNALRRTVRGTTTTLHAP